MLSLPSLKPFNFFFSIFHHSFSIFTISLLLINSRLWKVSILPIFRFLLNYFFLCHLSIKCFGKLTASFKMLIHFFRITLNQSVFVPYLLCFMAGLFGINYFFIFSFNSFLSLFLLHFCVIFNPLHYNLLIEIFFSFDHRFIRVMLKLNSLPNTIHLK